jgi:hypothetical protein
VKRYQRRVRFRISRLRTTEDELRGELEGVGLRLERLSVGRHDVLVDVSLDAESAEEADARALLAAHLLPAWRVVLERIDPPAAPGTGIERDRRRDANVTVGTHAA